MTPLVGGKQLLSPETLGTSRVGAHHQTGLLMFHHLGQNTELGCAPASGAANWNASHLMHQLDMSSQVSGVPEAHIARNTSILTKVIPPSFIKCPTWQFKEDIGQINHSRQNTDISALVTKISSLHTIWTKPSPG